MPAAATRRKEKMPKLGGNAAVFHKLGVLLRAVRLSPFYSGGELLRQDTFMQ